MLRLEYDGRNISIRFTHDRLSVAEIRRIVDTDELDCDTADYLEMQDNSWRRPCSLVEIFVDEERVACGISICHPNDNFSKSIGRKRALANALWLIYGGGTVVDGVKAEPDIFNKACRTAIWKEYLFSCKTEYCVKKTKNILIK